MRKRGDHGLSDTDWAGSISQARGGQKGANAADRCTSLLGPLIGIDCAAKNYIVSFICVHSRYCCV